MNTPLLTVLQRNRNPAWFYQRQLLKSPSRAFLQRMAELSWIRTDLREGRRNRHAPPQIVVLLCLIPYLHPPHRCPTCLILMGTTKPTARMTILRLVLSLFLLQCKWLRFHNRRLYLAPGNRHIQRATSRQLNEHFPQASQKMSFPIYLEMRRATVLLMRPHTLVPRLHPHLPRGCHDTRVMLRMKAKTDLQVRMVTLATPGQAQSLTEIWTRLCCRLCPMAHHCCPCHIYSTRIRLEG